MKPKNNKPFCHDCGRPKMFFETEKKAQNFIKFNGQDILRDGQTIDQLRVYYCPSCCGYHISSKPFKKTYEHNTERLINAYNIQKNTQKKFKESKLSMQKPLEEVVNDIKEQLNTYIITTYKELNKDIIEPYFKKHEYKQFLQDKIRHYFKIYCQKFSQTEN